jgi:hypothetical protein
MPIGLLMYLVTPLALLEWFGGTFIAQMRFTASEKMALALGLGAGLPALLVELTSLVGVPLSPLLAWLYIGCGMAFFICRFVRSNPFASKKNHQVNAGEQLKQMLHGTGIWLILLILLALGSRFYAIRALPVGLLGDSYHHTMMAQLLVENGGLFTSWQPYADLGTFTYHFGFHANVAMLTWLTGLETPRTVLFVGQFMSVWSVPLAYVFTSRWVKLCHTQAHDRSAEMCGLLAATFTGFYNLHPAYVVNMGRYTQLTGQNVMVAALVLWAMILHAMALHAMVLRFGKHASSPKDTQLRGVALTAIVTACLFQTHYIVTIFTALFIATLLILLMVRAPNWQTQVRLVGVAVSIASLAIALALPWLLNTLNGFLVRNMGGLVSQTDADEVKNVINATATLAPILPHYIKPPLFWLAILGGLFALRRQAWWLGMLVLWSGLLVILVVPQVLFLPGAGIIDALTAYSPLYITVIPLAAYALVCLIHLVPQALLPKLRVAISVLCFMFALWGFNWQKDIVEYDRQIFTQADWQAMHWISQNTPAKALFFVNGFPAYGGSLIAGTDGGWWIPLMTRRRSTLPPMTYGSERGLNGEDLYGRVNPFYQNLRRRKLTDLSSVNVDLTRSDALDLLRNAGVTHIYKGAKSFPPPPHVDSINFDVMRNNPAFKLIYAIGGVEIYEVLPTGL